MKCPGCKHNYNAKRNLESITSTTIAKTYVYRCPHCGYTEYVYAKSAETDQEIQNSVSDDIVTPQRNTKSGLLLD